MKKRILWGQDPYVAQWVAQRIPHMDGGNFGVCTTAAVMNDNGEILGAVVFSEYRSSGDVQISIAADSKFWLSHEIICSIFKYPFFQLKCRRLTSYTKDDALNVRKILVGFGFKQEGIMRRAFLDGDAIIYGMLAEECKWLKE